MDCREAVCPGLGVGRRIPGRDPRDRRRRSDQRNSAGEYEINGVKFSFTHGGLHVGFDTSEG